MGGGLRRGGSRPARARHAGHALPHRLHHQALHRDVDPPAPRRGRAAARRSRDAPLAVVRRPEPARRRAADHHPAPHHPHLGTAARGGLPVLDGGRVPDAGAAPGGPGPAGGGAPDGDAVEVLEPRAGARRRGRGGGLRRALCRLRRRPRAAAARHDEHARPLARSGGRAARARLCAPAARRKPRRRAVHRLARHHRRRQHDHVGERPRALRDAAVPRRARGRRPDPARQHAARDAPRALARARLAGGLGARLPRHAHRQADAHRPWRLGARLPDAAADLSGGQARGDRAHERR